MTHLTRISVLLGLALAACGDDGKSAPADAPPANIDAAVMVDAAIPYKPPTAVPVPISAGGPDQLQSVVAGADNSFFAAGFFSETPTGPRALTVFKLKTTGVPDATFGGDAFADVTGIDFKGGNDEIDVAQQADGKIVVSATVAAATPAVTGDTDIAVVRLLANGDLDATFGTGGIKRIDLNTGANFTVDTTTRVRGDNARGLVVNANGIFVHAISRAVGADRVDQDFTVVKLGLTDGAVDTAFGNQTVEAQKGQFRLNFDKNDVAARGIKALDGGKLLAVGYATIPPGAGQPVLYKLTATGQLDTTFNPAGAVPGVFHDKVLTQQTEVYNVAIHGDKIVTGGYGREAATPNINNYVSLRFDLNTGARDTAWGAATNGVVIFDPSGTGLSSNCRGAHALPNGKTLLIGSFGSGGPVQDAVFAVLDADGKLDKTYGTGINSYKLGTDGNDQFWGAAVNGNRVVIVGYKGETTQTETVNDNSWGLLFDAL